MRSSSSTLFGSPVSGSRSACDLALRRRQSSAIAAHPGARSASDDERSDDSIRVLLQRERSRSAHDDECAE